MIEEVYYDQRDSETTERLKGRAHNLTASRVERGKGKNHLYSSYNGISVSTDR